MEENIEDGNTGVKLNEEATYGNIAAADTWRGEIRIEGRDKTIWSGMVNVTSSVNTALNESSGEMETHEIPYPTVLGALDEASHQGGFSYLVVYYPNWNAFYVKTIADESDWWHYLVDYKVPMVDAGGYRLTTSDKEILWGYLESFYVHALRITVDKKAVNQSEELVVAVYNESMFPVEDAIVHVYSLEWVTNESGRVAVKIHSPGVYKM